MKLTQYCKSTVLQLKKVKTATMRYYYTPFRMTKIQTLTSSNPDKHVEQQELSFISGGKAKC